MFDDSRPIFQQLADSIESDILRGKFAEEEQVPSTNELATFFRINPATAGKALNLLVEKNVLYKRRGIGMFVTASARELIASERKENFTQNHISPMIQGAHELGLGKEELLGLVADSFNSLAVKGKTQ